ncbi:hypothetical protein DJ84_01645, partial [Halorubrum ezzemoulense]
MTTTTDEEMTTESGLELPAEESFADAVQRVVRRVDIILLLFPAAVLLVIGLFPSEIRRQLAFSYADPSVLAAFTSNFTHANSVHLLRNLTAYLVVVPTAYLLSVLADRRQLFYTVFVVVFVTFPFVLS